MSKVSIVLSTYNGEKYILEQLNSLYTQSYQADEVIIVDDASQDATVSMIKQFIGDNGLENWKVYINEHNCGWKKNFINALKRSTGDIVFLCDQDDVWRNSKIQEMLNVMKEKEDILVLASNYLAFYERNGSIYKTKEMANGGRVYKYPMDQQLLYIKRPGCVFAVRRKIIEYIDKYLFDDYPHDAFVWRTALLLDGLYIYDKMTIEYRRHDNTATGREKRNGKSKVESLSYYSKVIDKMREFVENEDVQKKEEKLYYLQRAERWCQLRKNALVNANYFAWLKGIGYIEYYYSIKSWVADFFMLKDYKNEKKAN